MTTQIASQTKAMTVFQMASVAVLAMMPVVRSPAANVSTNRFNIGAIYSEIAKSEYDINWQPRVAAYQCPNRPNNLRFSTHANGFSAERRAPRDITDNWRVTFTLVSYGSRTR